MSFVGRTRGGPCTFCPLVLGTVQMLTVVKCSFMVIQLIFTVHGIEIECMHSEIQ